MIPSLFSFEVSSDIALCCSKFLLFRIDFGISVFQTNRGSGFPFLFCIRSEVATLLNSSRAAPHTTDHKNSARAGFYFGVERSSSSENTCKMEEGVICFRKGTDCQKQEG